uniref:Uncharacterized protein n=1 Tax=Curvibacter symbiont subsp. Hydra magnipapillata TaxID=667019 RepID=C9YAJ6_CURXX|nr:hypothetical protein Csp_A11470 [Curvibacter putative symbiont of Hydra magnipapillata]
MFNDKYVKNGMFVVLHLVRLLEFSKSKRVQDGSLWRSRSAKASGFDREMVPAPNQK